MKKETVVTKVEETKPLTEAEKIWLEIQDCKIDMFALPNQTVKMYCAPVTVEPTKLYLKQTATSVLPSLEQAISPKFSVERTDLFIIVSRTGK